MRITDRHIGLSVLSTTLFAILLLSVLLVLGNLFKEIRPLLVEIGAPLWVLFDFILSVLPVSLIYTVPWAFLAAVLLVFGRLSSDNELNACRAAGISLYRLAVPVVVLGAIFSALCMWLNLQVAPEAKWRVNEIVTRTIIEDPRSLLKAGVDQSRIQNVKVYSEYSEGDVFHNFHVFATDAENEGGDVYIHADTAETVVDKEKQQIRLRLTGAYSDGVSGNNKSFTFLSEDLEWMVIDYAADFRRRIKPSAMTNPQIDDFLAENPELPEKFVASFKAEQVRRYTTSMACIVFALIGVPLGIKARRRDTSTGLIFSLGIGATYFFASSMIESSKISDLWMLWIPNILSVVLGIFLFRRARFR